MSETQPSSPTETAAKTARFAFPMLLGVVFLDAVGFGIIMPVTPALIIELTGVSLSEAAVLGGWLLVLYSALSFIFAPIVGNLSDRFGRRPVILACLLTFGIDYLIMGLAPDVFWLFFGRALAGISGASFVSANAYVSDITAPEDRAHRFGQIGAAWGLGFIAGPAIGGLLGEIDARLPFFVASAVCFVTFALALFLLPESLPTYKRRVFNWRRAHGFGTIKHMRAYPVVFMLLLMFVLYEAAYSTMAVWVYFVPYQFDWSPGQVGLSLAVFGASIALIEGNMVKPMVNRFGEKACVYVGTALCALSYVGFAFAWNGWVLSLLVLPWCVVGLSEAATRALMSRGVPEDEQGELQGAITAAMSLVAIFIPLGATQMFRVFTAENAPIILPGAPFLGAAVMLVFAVFWFWLTMKRAKADEQV